MTTAFYPIQNGTIADSDGYFAIPGNFTTMFTPGFYFVVIDSVLDGSPAPFPSTAITYRTSSSSFDGANTLIIPAAAMGSPLGSPVPTTIPTPTGEYVSLVGGGYSLDFTDPSKMPIVVSPGTVEDGGTCLNYPGRAVLNYGEVINENLLKLLENFASPTQPGGGSPTCAIEGQLWFDTSNPLAKQMRVWDGTEWIDVGGGGSEFWRDPVRIADLASYSSIADAETAINTTPQPQGIATPLADGDRVLFTDIGGGSPLDNSNVYIIRGTPGASPGAILEADDNRAPAAPMRGDATYVIEGSEAHSIYFYDENDEWIPFTGGGLGGIAVDYEAQVVTGSPQTVFTLSNPYTVTLDGSGLLVFVNGVKQQPDIGSGGAYTETDAVTVTFAAPQSVGKVVEFYILVPTTGNVTAVRELHDSVTGTAITIPVPPANIIFDFITYVPGTESLIVYLNGQKLVRGRDYEEIDQTTIQWTGVAVDTSATDRLEFYSYAPTVSGSKLGDIEDVDPGASYGSPPPGLGDVLTWDGSRWTPLSPSSLTGTNYFELVAAGGEGPIINVSPVNTQAKGSGKAYQRVYLNGVLLREGAGAGYTVTGANQITLIAPFTPLVASDELVVYED